MLRLPPIPCAIKAMLTLCGVFASIAFCFNYKKILRMSHKVGHISRVTCYPIACCAGIHGIACLCERDGMRMSGLTDRKFVIAEKLPNSKRFRQYFSRVLNDIRTFCDGKFLMVSKHGEDVIRVALTNMMNKEMRILVVNDRDLMAVDCGDEVAQWLANALEGAKVRLLTLIPNPTDAEAKTTLYTLHTESSLQYVGETLRIPNPEARLKQVCRANFFIAGSKPLDEQSWEEIMIGDKAKFKVISPALRFIQNRGVSEYPAECDSLSPLVNAMCTPASSLCLTVGVYAVLTQDGTVSIGDQVRVMYRPY